MAEAINPAGLVAVGLTGTELNDDIRGLLDRGVAGVILFARNVTSPAQVAGLCHDLKRYAGRPLLVMVDQEGGPTVRLKDGFTPLPTMRALGRTGDPAIARRVGEIVGQELRAVGIDFALAPVLDVDTNPDNPVIGQRSFSSDPAVVSAMACAVIEGIQSRGVAACGKHFPGHGDTAQDSHYTLPRLPHALDRLESIELQPFRAASRCGVAAIMSAHIVFEAIDPDRPATMSRAVIEGVLREQVGFDGVLTSDCMEMKAIADPENLGGDEPPMRHTPAAALAGLTAGLDIALVSHSTPIAHAAIDLIGRALDDGTLHAERAAQARARLDRMTARFARGPEPANLAALNTPEANAVTAPIIAADQASRRDPTAAFGRG
jgi:beta-N-acetylhexosaminidase